MNNTNNGTARMSFNNARAQIYDAWIASFGGNSKQCWDYVDSLKLAQHDIRLEVRLTPNNTNYVFGTIANQASSSNVQFSTEQRLLQQDTLVAVEYGIYVGLPSSDADTTFELQTFANPSVFTPADAVLINGTLFNNSKLKITVNNDVVVPGRLLFNNLYKPQTQQTAALGAGSPATQIRGADDGDVTMEPNIYLIGSKNTVPEVILPNSLTGLAATTARLIIIFRGLLAQNSTVVS